MPDGTVSEVIAWVNGDPNRAAVALLKEQRSETPREELITQLAAIVPDGTVPEIVTWVNGDPGRAALALLKEQRSESPRAELIAQLEALAGRPADPESRPPSLSRPRRRARADP